MHRFVVMILLLGATIGTSWSAAGDDYIMKSDGPNALIEHNMRPTVSAAGEVLEAAMGLHDYLAASKKDHAGNPNGDLVVNWSTSVQDKYGEPSNVRVIQLRLKNEDVRKIRFSEVSPFGLLDGFVDNVGTTKLGKEMLMDFCRKYRSKTPRFCQKAQKS